MKRGGVRLGAIAIILIIVALLIGAIFFVGRQVFGGSSTSGKLSAAQKLVAKPTASTEIQMSVRGPITAQENRYSVSVSISQSARSVRVAQGYDDHVIASRDLSNSTDAFRDMMSVLNNQGFMNSRETNLSTDGICPDGQLVRFQVYNETRQIGNLWTDSCNDSGTFAGETAVIQTILRQIPGGRSLIDNAETQISGSYSNNGSDMFSLQ